MIVGGGPTGVEVAAEMYDMITQDMARLYPKLTGSVKIRVIELMDHVLSTYDRKIGDYTGKLFKRNGIELVRAPASAQRTGTSNNIHRRCVCVFGPAWKPLRDVRNHVAQSCYVPALLSVAGCNAVCPRVQILNSRVTGVDAGNVTIADKQGNETQVPFGACVWATGVAMNPLIKQMQEHLKGQSHFRALLTDERLQVRRSTGSRIA